ncbi:GNAT family N-acetyltransferase [Plantactinospora sonchi]|uniref:GNAT family N-acetyltransferase n=1 Tax=Plantactinospora sonchi TaxID=1544735 RepID=A0ABU7RQ96_9ACTN
MSDQRGTGGRGAMLLRQRAAEVQRRPLTSDEAALMTTEIGRAPNITGYSRREWTGGRDTFVLVGLDGGEVIGATLVHQLAGNWSEIAVVYVREEFRGQGFGKFMLQAVLRTLKVDGRRKILFFSDAVMEKLVRDCGFRIFTEEDEFVGGRAGRWLFLKVVYKVQWLWSVYRIRELRRKTRELGSEFKFQIAVLNP